MNYKVEGAIKKTRKYFIIYAILWLFIVIVFIMPAGAAAKEATINGKFVIGEFIGLFGAYAIKPFSCFGKVFLPNYIGSDWSQRGEQYRILSNKKGIILGENNYLPVDKRGNVNVLVVGRFWFW